MLVGQVFHVLLTNECSLLYNPNYCVPSFSRHKLKLLSKCCVFKVRQYMFHIRFLVFPKTSIMRQYSKTCGKRPLSIRPKIGFQDQLSLRAGQKYCRMRALLSTFIKLPFVIKVFVLSILSGRFTQVFLIFVVFLPCYSYRFYFVVNTKILSTSSCLITARSHSDN